MDFLAPLLPQIPVLHLDAQDPIAIQAQMETMPHLNAVDRAVLLLAQVLHAIPLQPEQELQVNAQDLIALPKLMETTQTTPVQDLTVHPLAKGQLAQVAAIMTTALVLALVVSV